MTAPLAPLFLSPRRKTIEGKTCRDYVIRGADGASKFTARAFRVPGRITVYAPEAPDRPILLGEPRRSFPLTGRYDVHDLTAGTPIGVVTRSGRFYDASDREIGRFRDARSWKQHLREGLATAVLDALVGSEGSSDGPRCYGYVLTIGAAAAGTLARARLPFEVESPTGPPPGTIARSLRRALPKSVGDALFDRRETHAWKLDLADAHDVPEMLLLAATLLAIEMALW